MPSHRCFYFSGHSVYDGQTERNKGRGRESETKQHRAADRHFTPRASAKLSDSLPAAEISLIYPVSVTVVSRKSQHKRVCLRCECLCV